MRDALLAHVEATGQLDWASPGEGLCERLRALPPLRGGPNPGLDGHTAYIESVDTRRGAGRAEAMRRALTLVRTWALEERRLTWPGLCEVQGVVLGQERVGFRQGPAFAKGGRERYGFDEDLPRRFRDKIDRDEADGVHPVAGAARVYLDLCFFHPFADGNGRAARLALDLVLSRAGFAVPDARPIFLLPRVAGSVAGYLDLLRLLVLLCERGRRA